MYNDKYVSSSHGMPKYDTNRIQLTLLIEYNSQQWDNLVDINLHEYPEWQEHTNLHTSYVISIWAYHTAFRQVNN